MTGLPDRTVMPVARRGGLFVKVCGITRVEDALHAVSLGADALGFICWRGSPRFVDTARARAIAGALPRPVVMVGVFVDQPLEEITAVMGEIGLHAVQLHGRESPDLCRRIATPAIKSVSIDAGAFVPDPWRYAPEVTILVDAHDPVRHGGTGRTTDWSRAAQLAGARRVILAGGLTAHNVGDAIARVRPYGLDVSSSVERAPGLKDAARLEVFFRAVAAAEGAQQGLAK